MRVSRKGRVRDTGSYPTVCARIVSPTSVEIYIRGTEQAAPDDHFAVGPHRGVRVPRRGGVDCAYRHPAIAAWVVSAAGVRVVERRIDAAPHTHFGTAPDCRVGNSAEWRVGQARRRPTVRLWIVSAAGVQIDPLISSTPYDHFAPLSTLRCGTIGPRAH